MNKRIAVIFAAAVSLLLAGCGKNTAEEIPELIEPEEIKMDTQEVIRADLIQEKYYSGAVQPGCTEVFFTEDGAVEKVYAYNGKTAAAGDVIIELSSDETDKKLESLQEELDYLLQDGAYTDAVYDLELKILNTELAKLNSAVTPDAQAVEMKQLEIEAKNEEKEQAAVQRAASAEKLEKEIAEARAESAGQEILAPVDGNIYIDPSVSAGKNVRKDQTAFWIIDPSRQIFTVDSYISAKTLEKNSWRIVIGDREYTAEPVSESTEKINARYAAGQEVTTSFTFADGQDMPETGAYGCLIMETMHVKDVLQIPVNALMSDEDGNYVYVISDNVRIRRAVTIGKNNGINCEVKDGLEEGETVYVPEAD